MHSDSDLQDLARQARHNNGYLEMTGRSAQLGGWLVELPSRRLVWSAEVAAIFEQEPGTPLEFAGKLAHYEPRSRERFMEVFDTCVREGLPFDEEMEVVTARQRRIWVRTTGQAVRDAAAAIVGVQGATQDITARKMAEEEARRIATRLTNTLDSITDAFFTLDHEWRFTYLNRECERMLRHGHDQPLGRPVWDDFRRAVELERGKRPPAPAGTRALIEFEQLHRPSGRWLEVRAYSSEDGLAVHMRDATERRKAQGQLRLLELSVSRLNDLVLITEAADGGPNDQRIVFVNDAFSRHTGYSRDEVLGRTPRILQGPDTQRAELDRIAAALKAHKPVRAELVNYKRGGEAFWIELGMDPVADDGGYVTHWVAVGRDVTQRKAAEDRIQHLAFYDPLTQLPNRLVLLQRLEEALAACVATPDSGALMFIDLDDFKILNDTMGHDTGDVLLQQVARRLSGAAPPGSTVARLGGDEFVVMLRELGADPLAAEAAAQDCALHILHSLRMPYLLAGSEHHSTSSIGLTLFSGNLSSVSELLKQADLAMYQAKSSGRDNVCLFNPAMQAAMTAHANLSTDLRNSIREGHFVLHYQPQVGRNGRMSGVEALVRWQHPRRGLVQPSDFIPVAEDTGMILPLGQWVLETACAQLAAWARDVATAHLGIAVNVSVKQFRHPDFVDHVMASLAHSGARPSKLKLELTETLLADGMEVTIAKMGRLRDLGVTLALDDFGMGYSSLSSLKRIPLDQLKIDKTFVADILRDPNDMAIARAIIAMGQSLGLEVMAEGVETQAQRELLAHQGCHCYQGYLFCPPLGIAELEVFMAGLAPA